MTTFTAFRIHREGKGIRSGFETMSVNDLTAGDVLIQVAYSDINYKDALAATGKGRILRQYPLNGGIDMAGRVVSSSSAEYQAGDAVIACGTGLSEFLGINCMELPESMAVHCWERLAGDLKPRDLSRIASETVAFDQLPDAFDDLINCTQTGRKVVEINASI